MSSTDLPEKDAAPLSQEEMTSALFANLVIQQTNMALMFLGRVPHPETGETIQDIDSARMLIDQLEMLEVKTRGNLNKNEASLLKQSLTSLRMSFVQAVENPQPAPSTAKAQPQSESVCDAAASASSLSTPPPADEESRKKFTKRY
ncbi:MAG: DUF1844 domain-containing protein [Verrucomicrobia bacterium]|nr:DUF1844 domain-containing protein [Verrucomicrobiota bacterium]